MSDASHKKRQFIAGQFAPRSGREDLLARLTIQQEKRAAKRREGNRSGAMRKREETSTSRTAKTDRLSKKGGARQPSPCGGALGIVEKKDPAEDELLHAAAPTTGEQTSLQTMVTIGSSKKKKNNGSDAAARAAESHWEPEEYREEKKKKISTSPTYVTPSAWAPDGEGGRRFRRRERGGKGLRPSEGVVKTLDASTLSFWEKKSSGNRMASISSETFGEKGTELCAH